MLLSEAWRSLTANLSTTFAAAITVLIGMALVGMLVGFGTYARAWTDKTKKELVVNVYFCTDQTCAAYATPSGTAASTSASACSCCTASTAQARRS